MSRKLLVCLVASGVLSGVSAVSNAGIEAYVQGATATPVWKNSFGECWHTGTWTKEAATVEGCDGYVKPAPPAPMPVAEAAPAPAQVAPPAPPPPTVYTLKADVLFDFDRSVLKPEGKKTLDSFYDEIKAADPNNGFARVSGHADRIGTEQYNQRLSQARAKTVADYLVAKGKQQDKIKIEGLGESSPVTGSTCDKVRPRKALIACLAPDRRVEIEVQGRK